MQTLVHPPLDAQPLFYSRYPFHVQELRRALACNVLIDVISTSSLSLCEHPALRSVCHSGNQLAGKRNWQECDKSGSLKRDIHQGTNTPSARAKVPSAAASTALKEERIRGRRLFTIDANDFRRLGSIRPLPTSSLHFSTLPRNSSLANSASAATHGALRVLSSTRWVHPTESELNCIFTTTLEHRSSLRTTKKAIRSTGPVHGMQTACNASRQKASDKSRSVIKEISSLCHTM